MAGTANAGAIYAGIGQDLVTGTVLSAAFGTPLPVVTQAFFEANLDPGFKDNGYIGEAGVTLSTGRSFTDIKDMDGTILDSVQTEFNGTLKTSFLELNEYTLGNLFGPTNVVATVSTATAGNRLATVIKGDDLDPVSWVFRMKSGSRRVGIVVPKGRITEQGDLAFTSSGAVSIDCTIKTIPVGGVDCYVITDDGVWALSLVPTITSILPTGKSIGDSLTIVGTRFTGTTGVTIDAVPVVADNVTIVDDNHIVVVIPAGVVTAAPVVVTNASGASAPVSYTVV